ncbi:hypothetical protein [Nonomuraea typhae]|nr:hypothetical protein [Nonomuraea typhae]
MPARLPGTAAQLHPAPPTPVRQDNQVRTLALRRDLADVRAPV